jgi:putative ABC transport system ATP-binding protein
MSDVPLLRTERLCKTYPDGQVNALVDVSLTIRRGEYVAIMGTSGCGKSSLLNLLGGLDQPTSGEVLFEGTPLSKLPDLDRFRARNIGFVFQSFFLLPTLTALENVQIPMFEGTLAVRQREARARELLELVGMSHRVHHRPMQLSVGERQRIAIARALANDPILLLADEPTGNLDSRTAVHVLDLFAHLHRDKGMTIVMVTHGAEVAERAQRIVRMRDGRLCAEDQLVSPARAQAAIS